MCVSTSVSVCVYVCVCVYVMMWLVHVHSSVAHIIIYIHVASCITVMCTRTRTCNFTYIVITCSCCCWGTCLYLVLLTFIVAILGVFCGYLMYNVWQINSDTSAAHRDLQASIDAVTARKTVNKLYIAVIIVLYFVDQLSSV